LGNLLSVGLDVGTTTTQLILSDLSVKNKGGAFSVPEMVIENRNLLYQSPVIFTPLVSNDRVDGEKIARWVDAQYALAGVQKSQVDTGAVIITGETSRKENAREVLNALSGFAGDFVVATAGPDLESSLSAKGAGATEFSAQTGKSVLHMDIGGGTSNLSYIENGKIIRTGCLNVGGRLIKFDKNGAITYISPVLMPLCPLKIGETPTESQLAQVTGLLVQALEMAAALRPKSAIFDGFATKEATKPWEPVKADVISFSGGVADCIEFSNAVIPSQCAHWRGNPPDNGEIAPQEHFLAALGRHTAFGLVRNDRKFLYGDLGVLLGQAIGQSALCQGQYRLGTHTIRATVIGAGCHSTQLSGSTVFISGVDLPRQNLPVVPLSAPVTPEAVAAAYLGQDSDNVVLALEGERSPSYASVQALAGTLVAASGDRDLLICLQADMAKALGHAIFLLAPEKKCLCIDAVALTPESYLDLGAPIGPALPVVVKTLVLDNR